MVGGGQRTSYGGDKLHELTVCGLDADADAAQKGLARYEMRRGTIERHVAADWDALRGSLSLLERTQTARASGPDTWDDGRA
jgi:hypothetical protein